MENQVEINISYKTSIEELVEIIKSNPAEVLAKSIHEFLMKELNKWANEYERAETAEKELTKTRKILADAYLKQLSA